MSFGAVPPCSACGSTRLTATCEMSWTSRFDVLVGTLARAGPVSRSSPTTDPRPRPRPSRPPRHHLIGWDDLLARLPARPRTAAATTPSAATADHDLPSRRTSPPSCGRSSGPGAASTCPHGRPPPWTPSTTPRRAYTLLHDRPRNVGVGDVTDGPSPACAGLDALEAALAGNGTRLHRQRHLIRVVADDTPAVRAAQDLRRARPRARQVPTWDRPTSRTPRRRPASTPTAWRRQAPTSYR